jgi:hypothetical protein
MTPTTPVYSRPRYPGLRELGREPGSIYLGSIFLSIHIINVNHDLITDYGYYILQELSCFLAFPLRPWLNRAWRPSNMISAQKSNDEKTIMNIHLRHSLA